MLLYLSNLRSFSAKIAFFSFKIFIFADPSPQIPEERGVPQYNPALQPPHYNPALQHPHCNPHYNPRTTTPALQPRTTTPLQPPHCNPRTTTPTTTPHYTPTTTQHYNPPPTTSVSNNKRCIEYPPTYIKLKFKKILIIF
jgi:hypothetical protein